jgi:hypothetical protein
MLKDISFIENIEKIDRITVDLYKLGDEDERTRHEEIISKLNQDNELEKAKLEDELSKKKLKYENYQSKWNFLESKRLQQLINEETKHDHIIQSGLNDMRDELVVYFNQIKDNYSDDKFMALVNVYLRLYLINIFDREHRVAAYTDLKAKYSDEAGKQLNMTNDHLVYINELEIKLEREIKNDSRIASILIPKINSLNDHHAKTKKISNEIINEFKYMMRDKNIDDGNSSVIRIVIITCIMTAFMSIFLIISIILAIKPIRIAVVKYIKRFLNSSKNVKQKNVWIFKKRNRQPGQKLFEPLDLKLFKSKSCFV